MNKEEIELFNNWINKYFKVIDVEGPRIFKNDEGYFTLVELYLKFKEENNVKN